MDSFAITVDGPVAIATMSDGENKVGSAGISAWHEMLDTVENEISVSSLVVVGMDKYWSTGLDLTEVEALSEPQRLGFLRNVDLLLGRVLTLPLVTVAALNGHTYAAGALIALAFDYRVMRSDHGFFCLPSVDVGIAFSPGMSSLISAKLPQPIAHDLVVSCRRIGGLEAERAGVVNRAVEADSVLPVARELAYAYSEKDPSTLSAVKRRMYPEAASMLTVEP